MTRSQLPLGRQTALPFAGVWFVTLFAAAWNAIVNFALLPNASFQASGFKWVFLGAGVLMTTLVVFGWRQRIRGGPMHLTLSQAEIPVGVTVAARFETDKPLQADDWQATLKVDAPGRRHNTRRVLLRQPVAVTALGDRLLQASLRVPANLQWKIAEYPPHHLRGTLTVKSRIASWEFAVAVRPATAEERSAEKAKPDLAQPARSRALEAAKEKRSAMVAVLLGFICLAIIFMFWSAFRP